MKYLLTVLLLFSLAACDFQEKANKKFGDQHFKTAISLIELHKTRFGKYPQSLNDLKFIGEWDMIALRSVKYVLVEDGYTLSVINGWVGKPSLKYPEEFWQGLGIVQDN